MHNVFKKQRYVQREHLLLALSLGPGCYEQPIVHFSKLSSPHHLPGEIHRSWVTTSQWDTYKNHMITLHFDSQVLGVSLQFERKQLPHYFYTLHLRRRTSIVPLLTRSEPPDDDEAEKAEVNPVVSGL